MRFGLILLSVLVVLTSVGGMPFRVQTPDDSAALDRKGEVHRSMELNRWNIPPRDAEGVSLNEIYMYDEEDPLVLQIKQPML